MDSTKAKSACSLCGKQTRVFTCQGCAKQFCRNDFAKHLEVLDKQLDQITNEHNELLQKISSHKTNPDQSPLLEKINRWERESMEKIQHHAREYRNRLVNHAKRSIDQVESQLENLAKKIKQIREENDFNEIDLKEYQEVLHRLDDQLQNPARMLIEKSTAILDQIPLNLSLEKNSKWKKNGTIIAGENQLQTPKGICVTNDQTLYVADFQHHRIMEWKANTKEGRIVAGGQRSGKGLHQLSFPSDVLFDRESNSLIIAEQGNKRVVRWSLKEKTAAGEVLISNVNCSNLAMDKDGSIYASDQDKHVVKRWRKGEQKGTVVAGGNGKGRRLDQLDEPTYLFVDHQYSLYVTDRNNRRVMKWRREAKEGTIAAGGGDARKYAVNQFSEPSGLFVDRFDQVYVADAVRNRVVRWCEEDQEGSVIVGEEEEEEEKWRYALKKFDGLASLTFDGEGNLYVADSLNQRVWKFELDLD